MTNELLMNNLQDLIKLDCVRSRQRKNMNMPRLNQCRWNNSNKNESHEAFSVGKRLAKSVFSLLKKRIEWINITYRVYHYEGCLMHYSSQSEHSAEFACRLRLVAECAHAVANIAAMMKNLDLNSQKMALPLFSTFKTSTKMCGR